MSEKKTLSAPPPPKPNLAAKVLLSSYQLLELNNPSQIILICPRIRCYILILNTMQQNHLLRHVEWECGFLDLLHHSAFCNAINHGSMGWL